MYIDMVKDSMGATDSGFFQLACNPEECTTQTTKRMIYENC